MPPPAMSIIVSGPTPAPSSATKAKTKQMSSIHRLLLSYSSLTPFRPPLHRLIHHLSLRKGLIPRSRSKSLALITVVGINYERAPEQTLDEYMKRNNKPRPPSRTFPTRYDETFKPPKWMFLRDGHSSLKPLQSTCRDGRTVATV
jgi:hypothetical protein